jgi:hypothetical protein
MDEALLEKREGQTDNDNETTTWVEYWDGDELVHRSVHVQLKKPMISVSEIGGFS